MNARSAFVAQDWQLVALGCMPLNLTVECRYNDGRAPFRATCMALNPENRDCGDEFGYFSIWVDVKDAAIPRPFQWRWLTTMEENQ